MKIPRNTGKEDILSLLNRASGIDDVEDNEAINKEFRENYGESLIEITYIPNESVQYSSDAIFVNHEKADDFLKNFGKSIKKIAIAYNLIPKDRHIEIGRLVNEHGHGTLEELQLKDFEYWVFQQINKPFTKVQRVVIKGDTQGFDRHSSSFDQLFPEIRVLDVTHSNGHIYYQQYPHLTEVNIVERTNDDFIQFIDKNQQIETLRLEDTSTNVLKTMSEKLAALKTLEFTVPVDLHSYEGPEIQFDKVTTVSINDMLHNIRFTKLSFNNLEHLELAVDGNIKNEWLELLENSKHLKTLEITSGSFNDATLLGLSDNFKNLIEAKINCDSAVSAENVATFIATNKGLKAITLEFPVGSVLFAKNLNKRLNKEWKISRVNQQYSILTATRLETPVDIIDTDAEEPNKEPIEETINEEPPKDTDNKPGEDKPGKDDQNAQILDGDNGGNLGGDSADSDDSGASLGSIAVFTIFVNIFLAIFI